MSDRSVNTVWRNNEHVESYVNNGENSFVNAAHTVVYAQVHTGSSATGKFYAVGLIQGWSFTEQRQVDEVFELGSDIRYIVPGRTTGQIAITRLLINGNDLLNTLYQLNTGASGSPSGENNIKSLKDINTPLDLMFVTYNNDDAATTHTVRYFDNCWIVARQESITANQVVIAENCSIVYEKIDTSITGIEVA